MNEISFVFDFLWKLLVISALSASFILGPTFVLSVFMRRSSVKLSSSVLRLSVVSFLVTLALSTLLLIFVDKNLQAECFRQFVNLQENFAVTRILASFWILVSLCLLLKDLQSVFYFNKHVEKGLIQKREFYWLVKDSLPAMTLGIWGEKVLIPQSIERDPLQLEHVLSHEQIHLKNKDGFWSFLALIIRRICWFHPVLFFFERERVLVMEMLTDEETVRNNDFDTKKYAQSLLKAVCLRQDTGPSPLAVGAADFVHLKKRLEKLKAMPSKSAAWKRCLAFSIWAITGIFGVHHSLASIQLTEPGSASENMCYQVQHEKVIESWLQIKSETNKCE